jgi:uncharacterized coiled-coil protein SlyX
MSYPDKYSTTSKAQKEYKPNYVSTSSLGLPIHTASLPQDNKYTEIEMLAEDILNLVYYVHYQDIDKNRHKAVKFINDFLQKELDKLRVQNKKALIGEAFENPNMELAKAEQKVLTAAISWQVTARTLGLAAADQKLGYLYDCIKKMEEIKQNGKHR